MDAVNHESRLRESHSDAVVMIGMDVGLNALADQAAIGFLGAAPDADGPVRTLDRTKPVFDKARGNLSLLVTYNTKLFNDRIRARFQLNVQNVNESGHLQAVAVNPDGSPWQYRIIDPRQFILTASFDL